MERADETGSRWSRGQLSGRTRPDRGPRKWPETPWTLPKERGQARTGEPGAWVSEKKRKGSGRREGAAGLSAGARRGHPGGWQGPSRIPKGSRTHLGGRHCRRSTHGWERSGGDRCVWVHKSEQPCVQRRCPVCTRPPALSVCARHQRGCAAPVLRLSSPAPAGTSGSPSRCPACLLGFERRRRGARGPSALASLSHPRWRVKYQTPSGPQTPVASVTCSSSLPGLPSLTFLLISTLTPWARQRSLEPPGRVQGEGADAPAPQGGTGVVRGAGHENPQVWGPQGA